MARDLAAIADSRTLLDFNKRANLGFVANLTAVEVNEGENLHVRDPA